MLYLLILMKRALNFVFISLLVFTCSSQKEQTDAGLYIENDRSAEGQIANVFASHRLIQLNATINRIDDLIVDNERMVVVDRSMETLYVFDHNGNLLKLVQGDILSNGKFIQPVCLTASKNGDLVFYEAANQMIFKIDKNNIVTPFKESPFYIRKLYPYNNGYLAFKNQSVQNEEGEEYWYDLLEIDNEFNLVRGHFPFRIEENVPRNWQYFDDPVNITSTGFEFYQPLTSTYKQVNFSGTVEEQVISFNKRPFKDRYLETVNREEPYEVLDKIFNRYALLNAKKIESDNMTAVRYVDAGKVYYNMDIKGSGQSNYSEFSLSVDNSELPVPYPMIVQKDKWYSVLDLESYDAMNLKEYIDVHPLLDNVIEGKTYLLELNL